MSNLAINGGTPVRVKPYPVWPAARGKERQRLLDVLGSDDRERSSEVDRLGKEFALFAEAEYALPVSSGTTALEIIFRALGIGRGDEVILPIYTFVASASSILYTGAVPVFADALYSTHLLDPASVEKNITPRTKAVLAVHIGGRPCDMDALLEIGERRRLYVIEDAAQAHGASWKGRKAGSIGIAGSFSFQASKNLPCGEGGMITTGDKELYLKMKSIAGYRNGSGGERDVFGTNAVMSAWQAAVLSEQLKDADVLFEKRSSRAKKLTEALREFPFIELTEEDDRVTGNAYHLFIFRYNKEKLYGVTREELLELLAAEGIEECLSSGYSQPITDMDIMRGPDFLRATGSKREYSLESLPVGKALAYEKGMWLYQAALLEEDNDLLAFPAALEKLVKNKDEVLEYVKGRREYE